jgi:hypothetical protein
MKIKGEKSGRVGVSNGALSEPNFAELGLGETAGSASAFNQLSRAPAGTDSRRKTTENA